jgi:hypothetical protein
VITGYSGSTYYINDPYYGTGKLSDHYGSDPASAIHRILPYHLTSNWKLISLIGDVYKNGCDIAGDLSLNVKELIFNGKTSKNVYICTECKFDRLFCQCSREFFILNL